jgi:competence protein ComEC
MTLIYLSLSWLSGVYLGSSIGLAWGLALVALAGVFISVLLLRRPRALLLFGLCLILLAGGIARYQATIPAWDENALQFYNDKENPAQIEGLVAADPEPGDDSTALRLEHIKVKTDGEWREVSGAALIYAPSFPDFGTERDFPYYRYGDLLRIEGYLETPPELEDFDWAEYLARQGIYSIIRYPDNVELVASGQGVKPLEWLYGLRTDMSQALDQSLSEPQNSLAQAVLLGKRSSLPLELKEEFASTGTAHIIAVSGLHVGIVAGIVLSLGVYIFGRRRPTYLLFALIAVWLYATLTGLQPPVFRAAIMGSLWLFGDYIGRPRSALTALLLAAAIMVGIQPLLLWDASFQLSFAAMAGLVFLTPKFQDLGAKALGGISEKTGWRASSARFVIDILSVTLGAILFTLPLIAFYFHRISIVALPANFFILPAVPGIIITAALAGIVGLFALPLAQVLGWVTWLSTTYAIKVNELFSALPFASVDVEVGMPLVCTYYVLIAVALFLIAKRRQLRRWLAKRRNI